MSPIAAALLSALAMTGIVALRYLASSGLFAWLTARVRPGFYAGLGPQMRKEIGWSLARVKALAGAAPLFAAGVSLGGNAFCKWLGTKKTEKTACWFSRGAAICHICLVSFRLGLNNPFLPCGGCNRSLKSASFPTKSTVVVHRSIRFYDSR